MFDVMPRTLLALLPLLAGSLLGAKPPEEPPAKGPDRLLIDRARRLTLIDPDGKNEKELSKESPELTPGNAKLSPDGKRLAAIYFTGEPRSWRLHVRGIDEKAPGTDLGVECTSFAWSADGIEIAYSWDPGEDDVPRATHGIVNVKTKRRTPLMLPESHSITGWSRDGEQFLTLSMEIVNPRKWSQNVWKLHLMNRDGTQHKALTDGKRAVSPGKLSPDGKRVLYLEREAFDDPPYSKQRGLKVLDVATGKFVEVEGVPLNAELRAYCWSPDGKRIAYAWSAAWEGNVEDRVNKEMECFLMVSDWNGKNAKTIATVKGTFQIGVQGDLTHIDWR